MYRDRNILDVVRDLNTEFRHNPAFTVMLNKLDERAERRIAKLYVEWLYRAIEEEKQVAREDVWK
jgi:hypothetical protein